MTNKLHRTLLASYILAFTVSLLGIGSPLTRSVSAACSALPTNLGTATFTVNVPSDGTYRFWTHTYSPSGGNDAFYMQVDQSYCQITVGNTGISAGQFKWIDYQNGSASNKINLSLSAGNHAFTLAGLDPSVGVDKIILSADASCVPTGDGGNCTNSSPSAGTNPIVTPPAGSGTSSSTPSVTGTISLPGAANGSTVTYYLNGKPVEGDKLDTTKLADGKYTLKRVEVDPTGKTTETTQEIIVDNYKTFIERAGHVVRSPWLWIALLVLLLATAYLVLRKFKPDWITKGKEWVQAKLLRRKFIHPQPVAQGAVVYVSHNSHKHSWWRGLFVLSFALVGTATVLYTFAATPSSVSYMTWNGSVANGANVVSKSDAIGGKMVQFAASAPAPAPTPSPTPPPTGGGSCALPKYPTPSCTGVPAGTTLTTLTLNVDGDSYAVTTPGTVINGKHIPGNLLVWADNVTIKNSQIDGNIYNDQGATIHPYTIMDSTIGRADRCETQPGLLYARYTATRVKVIGHDDGFRVSTPGNVTITDSYAQLCWNPPEIAPPDGSHSGGIQADCRADPNWPDSTCYNVVFNHNTIDNSKVVNGQRVGNSSFTMQSCATANSGCGGINPISGVTVSDNLFMGGGYIMWPWWTMGPNYEMHNNRIVNGSWTYGPVDANGTCAHQNWSGNTIVNLSGYSPSQSYAGNYDIISTVSPLNCIN